MHTSPYRARYAHTTHTNTAKHRYSRALYSIWFWQAMVVGGQKAHIMHTGLFYTWIPFILLILDQIVITTYAYQSILSPVCAYYEYQNMYVPV